ncbi:MAG: hypothetical protein OWU84_15595, partial [Firmicutes bacterium]|nr:hypothetical protein [Bacillota bacterium]
HDNPSKYHRVIQSVFAPLWSGLAAIPPVAPAPAELPLSVDPVFHKLAALWPRIGPDFRTVVLRVAEELAQVKG